MLKDDEKAIVRISFTDAWQEKFVLIFGEGS